MATPLLFKNDTSVSSIKEFVPFTMPFSVSKPWNVAFMIWSLVSEEPEAEKTKGESSGYVAPLITFPLKSMVNCFCKNPIELPSAVKPEDKPEETLIVVPANAVSASVLSYTKSKRWHVLAVVKVQKYLQLSLRLYSFSYIYFFRFIIVWFRKLI